MNSRKFNHWYLLFAGGLVYFIVAVLFRLDRLGMNADESANALAALEIFEVWTRDGFAAAVVRTPMLMNVFYVGSLKYFLSWPFLSLGGYTLFVSRLAFVPYVIGLIVLVFIVMRRWFGAEVASVCSFLMCINSSLIRSSRTAFRREELLVAFLFWLGLWLIDRCRHKKSFWLLAGSGLFFGLALWTKLMFVAYLVGAVAGFLFLGRESRQAIKADLFNVRGGFFSFVGMFIVGSLPLIAYNVINNGKTLRMCWNSLFSSASVFPGGANNMNLVSNIAVRLNHFFDFLVRDIPEVDSIRNVPGNYIALLLFAVAFIFLSGCIISKKIFKDRERKKISFLLVFYITVFVLTAFTPRGLAQGHMLIMVPFGEIIAALFLCRVAFVRIRNRQSAGIVLAVSLLVLTCAEVKSLVPVYSDRGRAYFSPIPEELAWFFQEKQAGTVVVPYFMTDSIFFMSGLTLPVMSDAMTPLRHSAHLPYSDKQYAQIKGFDMYYLVTASGPGCFDYSRELLALIRANGKKVFDVKEFPARDEYDFNCKVSFVCREWNQETKK